MEKKLGGNYTRMLRAILNKSWKQQPTRHQLYGHESPITNTIKVRRTRHAGYCWRSRDELISDVLLWIPSHDQTKAERRARTYIQQLCEDTRCSPEDLQWMIGRSGKTGSGISVLAARQDDDDEINKYDVMPGRDGPENLRILKKSQFGVKIGLWRQTVEFSVVEA